MGSKEGTPVQLSGIYSKMRGNLSRPVIRQKIRCGRQPPGNEDRKGHIFPPSSDGTPYIHTDYAELRRLFNDPVTSEKERQLIVDAMRLLGVPRRDAPTEVRDEDFNYPNPNAPQGNSVRKADSWSR